MCVCGLENCKIASVFHEPIKSRLELVEHATERILERVGAMADIPTRLVLSEAIANAIIHGNQEDLNKKVQICGGLEDGNRLVLVITDEGAGFDPALIPDPLCDQNLFRPHGRGVFLMQHLMDQAEFRLGGRQVVLRKRLGGDSA